MQACLSAQRCHDGRSHALLEICRPSGDCVMCCLLEKSRHGMGYPRAGPFGRRRFFHWFSAHFSVTLEHLFFKRQNVEEKSAENLHKNLRAESLHKNGRKNLRTKNLRKNGRKHQRTKSAQKTGLNIPFVWKMEAPQKSAPNFGWMVWRSLDARWTSLENLCA